MFCDNKKKRNIEKVKSGRKKKQLLDIIQMPKNWGVNCSILKATIVVLKTDLQSIRIDENILICQSQQYFS